MDKEHGWTQPEEQWDSGSYLELEEAEAAAVRGLIAEARTYGRPATWRTIYERGSHASTAS